MFVHTAVIVAATLAAGAFAAPPVPGRYQIINPATRLRFDVYQFNTATRTPIVGNPPTGGDNQKWDIVQEDVQGESGIYTFTAVSPDRKVFDNGQGAGNRLGAEKYGTPFNVTAFGAGFTISTPISAPLLAVTTSGSAGSTLTLEVFDPTNAFQVWAFQATD